MSKGLQNALWQAGGAPQEHRSDSLSAAFKNLAEEEDFTVRYTALLDHYGMVGTRNNRGVSHENGSVESSHRYLKEAIEQALLLRGHRDFEDRLAYEGFVREAVMRRNRRNAAAFRIEREQLQDLPQRRTTDFVEEEARVTRCGTSGCARSSPRTRLNCRRSRSRSPRRASMTRCCRRRSGVCGRSLPSAPTRRAGQPCASWTACWNTNWLNAPSGDSWLEKGATILIFGPPGVGKSHLGCGIGHALIDAGYRVLYMRTSELVQRLQAARQSLQLPQALAKLDRYDLLILDDLSYVRRDQAETSVLFELIAERYERRSMLITANQPFSGWDNVFPDPGMTVAAIDRLVHHSTIFELHKVESYRGKEAARQQKIQRDNDKAQRRRQSSKDNDNHLQEPPP